MTLEVGARLGPYEVLSAIGAGGMGEVYRARDTKLQRDVAIKILPELFALDGDRRARFEREAQVLASLNHSHIAAIYGFEETRSTGAIIMEFVEGPTLADRILHGPLAVSEALRIAGQIVEALDAAHEKGIVHRDLKPANIKITHDGIVKVLDFGLAKAATADGSTPRLTQTVTETVGHTGEGIILGTAAYMSPEQARGQRVDKRTDIWAFGCVLYEMLTGKRAFGGATLTDTLAAIIEREPDWHALPVSTPPPVRRLVRRCLTKPVGRRLRDIGDAALELEHAAGPEESSTTVDRTRSRAFSHVAVAMAVVGAIALIVAGIVWRDRRALEPAIALGPMTRLTSDAGLTTEPSISADGRFVTYASNRGGIDNLDIYVQQTSGGAAIRLTSDPADDYEPTLSPDGSLVAFRSDRNPAGIYLASALGGSARLIAPEGRGPRFSPDGRSIAFWNGPWLAPRSVNSPRQVFVVAANGGSPTRLAADVFGAGDPVWAPDGRSLLVFGRDARRAADWWWVPIAGIKPVQTGAYARFAARHLDVTTTATFPLPRAWTDRGVLFSAADRAGDTRGLWRIAIDARSGTLSGDPVRLTHGTTIDVWPSVSHENRVVFAAQTVSELIFGLPIDANAGKVTGTMRRLRDDAAVTGRASLSEDGRLMVFPKYEFASGAVWARDLTTGREWQLAATPRTPLNPVITVDGQWTAYTITDIDTGGTEGPGEGYVVKTSSGAPRRVCEKCRLQQWTRDGRFVLVDEEGRRLSRLELATGNRTLLLEGPEPMDRVQFGPEGRWMTFNVPGRVYVAPVHSNGPSPKDEWTSIISTTGSERTAGLSPDGSLLYLLLEADGFRCVYGLPLDPKTGQPRGKPFLVAHFHSPARRWGSTGLGSAAVKGLFVVDLSETTSNIWMASFTDSGR